MQTLLNLFDGFEKRGDKTVFVHRTGIRRLVYSYRQFSKLSRQMAQWLKERGIKQGDRVLIWAPNGPWWAVAFWGCQLRGAVVVPVDFASGLDRAEKIKELTDARLVIQSQYKAERGSGPDYFLIEDLEYILPPLAPLTDKAPLKPDDLAELIYTSGTTGDPKGVMLTHRNLTANLRQVNESIILRPEYNFLSLLPLSHMFEQMGGFLSPLYRGSAIVYIKTLKPTAILEALGKEDIGVVILVPRILQVLRTSIERKLAHAHLGGLFKALRSASARRSFSARRRIFWIVQKSFGKNFKFFVSGGASLDPDLFRFWSEIGFKVIEGYGITECSPVLAVNSEERQEIGSVGQPIPGVEIKIEGGEILAKGENVFAGYYQNEKATKEAFTGDGWFRTGDLGLLDERALRIKGRQKEVIITSSGINIYPDDLESVLNKIAGVKEACIIGQAKAEGEEVQAVLILDGSGRTSEEIVKEANSRLDPLQQISGFTVWPEPEFPKTNTLKVQKFKVRQIVASAESSGNHHETVDRLKTIVGQACQKPVADITEDSNLLLDLGLTSLARLELVNCLEQEFKLDLEDTAINQETTLGVLRQIVTRREARPFRHRLRPWTNSAAMRGLRRLADLIFNVRVFNLLVKKKNIFGQEQVAALTEPVLFAANHISYIDTAAVYYALPRSHRYRVSVAAGDEFFFSRTKLLPKIVSRILYEYSSLLFNAFILPEKAGFRRILEHMGYLVDRGVSLLYFPEGGLTRRGVPLSFQPGVGLIVKELKIPVVPVKLEGLGQIVGPDSSAIRPGEATVKFGPPLRFTGESPSEITARIREAVYKL